MPGPDGRLNVGNPELVLSRSPKVALGLGFVIFIHELGHFLLAKWNGVKVEKFSIGFGPTLFGFRRGETEYVLAALPLGGFVKMLGEGPEDAREQVDRSPGLSQQVGQCADGDHLGRRDHEPVPGGGLLRLLSTGTSAQELARGPGRGRRRARRPTRRACAPATRSWRSTTAATSASPTLMQKVLLSSQGQVLHFEVQAPGPGRADRPGHPAAPRSHGRSPHDRDSSEPEPRDRRFSSPRPGWRTRPLIRRSRTRIASRRSTSWSRPVPPGREPTPLADSRPVRSPARQVRRSADHARDRAAADLAIRRHMARRSSGSS